MNSIGVRKAALAMASMHPADRRWMLARMPPAWRAALNPLLKEAQRFATMDISLLKSALSSEETSSPVEVPTPDVLIAVLDGLGSTWVARLLMAAAADHAEIYLATCAKQRAESIRREMAGLPATFPAALADAMARYLSDAGRKVSMVKAP
ncbi:hypothetical protein [Dyella tabacisoli]|uniref:Uncharacterized protein n=1 Tax=Dyella tabacisoli TaxID=2282381 RepID=A0A369ULG9_9GAMM|nr:hypothetical protein [Dyella tabacisoli]RDD81426.1 hypothetical protein DVJ77_11985 [Dyella tabacisoli]